MKIRRRTNQCYNCGSTLDKVYNYCPNCGQENNDNNVSFGTLVGDFFNTYFALDSTFGRSIKPFFFKPGYLTNRYVEGKRVSYAHPVRLYLIGSLFFFFVFTMAGKKVAQNNDQPIVQTQYSLNDVEGLDPETRKKLQNALPQKTLDQIKKDLEGDELEDLQKALKGHLSTENLAALKSEMNPQQQFLLDIIPADSLHQEGKITADTSQIAAKPKNTKGKSEENKSILERIDWTLINKMKDDRAYTDQQILDSMNLKNLSGFDEHIAMQSIRVIRADKEQFIEYILNNLPLMMFILIPIFALIIKLLYLRKKKGLYIHHLIHALHLHSFAYVFYGVSLLLIFYAVKKESIQEVMGVASFVIVSTYAYFSFLRVYQQHWFKTLIKFNIAGFIYFSCISIFLLCEMLISMLLF